MNVGVILSGGIGSRFGMDKPKQYLTLYGKEVIAYTIEELKKAKKIDKVLVVANHEEYVSGRIEKQYGVTVIEGGSSRAHSFNNAINYIKDNFEDCKKVVFHEAARPLVLAEVFDKYMDLLDEYDNIESCKHITDSLGNYKTRAANREEFYLIQAPEAYRFNVLLEYFDVDSDIYYAAHQLPDSTKGYKYFDIPYNYKLTYPDDVNIIEYFLKLQGQDNQQ